jgi:hypothetical protein
VVAPIGTPLLAGSTVPHVRSCQLTGRRPNRHGFHSTTSGRTGGASRFPTSCGPGDSCHTPCGPGNSSRTTCGPSGSSRTLRGTSDSCLFGAASWSSPTGVAFTTDRLRPLSMSTYSSSGTHTSDFDARTPARHGWAHDSPDKSAPDGHPCQGGVSDALRAPRPHRHNHRDTAISDPDLYSCHAC